MNSCNAVCEEGAARRLRRELYLQGEVVADEDTYPDPAHVETVQEGVRLHVIRRGEIRRGSANPRGGEVAWDSFS